MNRRSRNEATDAPRRGGRIPGRYRLTKSRWEIESQGFNDAKDRYALEPIARHQENSLLVGWLLLCLALTIERLYRLRYLCRAGRTPYSAISLVRLFWINFGAPPPLDTS